MKYYIIKREDTSPSPCPYYKEPSTWTGQWNQAQRFDDAVDAEYRRKHSQGDSNRRTFICEVELTEKEVVVQTTAIVTKQEGPGFTKR